MLLERLESQAGLSRAQLNWYAETASKRYKAYQIPKRNGDFRTIQHPSKQLKAIQRWLNVSLIAQLPVHHCATAYAKGSSIRDNACRHLMSNFTLRVDFRDFFPSFQAEHINRFFQEKSASSLTSLSEDDILFIQRIVCRNGALTIGAPSSPFLTNAMMYEFDLSISRWCSERSMTYSRYADDIFISTQEPNTLGEAFTKIREITSEYRFASLQLNNQKTCFLSRKYRRTITGVILTPARKLSVGRERKMRLKADVYAFKNQRLPFDEWKSVRGLLAFVSDVEPTFYEVLVRKYGLETINCLKELKKPITD